LHDRGCHGIPRGVMMVRMIDREKEYEQGASAEVRVWGEG